MKIVGTKTFSADVLWALRNKDKTTNIKLVEGNLVVEDQNKQASYESAAITSTSFVELVLSWNVRDLTTATINFKVAVGKEDNFSQDFIMGVWKKNMPASSVDEEDDYASLSHDILTNKDTNNNLIKLKFSIEPNEDQNFKINNISVTTKDNYLPLTVDESLLENIELAVPRVNQLSVPNIGNIICSPTSLTMVLNFYGNKYDAPTTAGWVKDARTGIYGNWTFNASTAGAHNNLYARVEYFKKFNKAFDYLKKGIPVILSINTKAKEDLPGALSAYPYGHLIVLVGFIYQNGIWYGILNDPAFYQDDDVRKLYPLDLLIKAYRGYGYIVTTEQLD